MLYAGGLSRSSILKPGGIPVATAINRFASLLDGISRGFIDDPEFVDILRHDLEEGQHRGVPSTTRYFTTAFFHRPDEVAAEISESGFRQRVSTRCRGRLSSPPTLKRVWPIPPSGDNCSI